MEKNIGQIWHKSKHKSKVLCRGQLTRRIISIMFLDIVDIICTLLQHITVMPEPGGPGGPLAPPMFGRSVNPIPTGEGRLSPPITTGTPNVFHLPASLFRIEIDQLCLKKISGHLIQFLKDCSYVEIDWLMINGRAFLQAQRLITEYWAIVT